METPKHVLHELERGSPGTRFQRLYLKRLKSRHGTFKNALFIASGIATIAVGVLSYAIPVIPSEPLIVIGVALVAQGSMRGARLLDAAEVRLRHRFAWALRIWRPLSGTVKVTLAVLWSTLLAALSYAVYRLLSS